MITKILWVIPFPIIVIIVIYFFFQGNPEPIYSAKTKILYTDSSVCNSNLTLSHNSSIILLLQRREATEILLLRSNEEDLQDSKNIYIALMSVLLPLILLRSKKEDDKNHKENIKIGSLFILVIIPCFLYLNSDIEEKQKRSEETCNFTHRALEELINSNQLSTVWFKLDYKDRNDQMSQVKHPFIRKLKRAAHPNPETGIFYWFPWIVVYFYQIISVFRRNSS